MTRATHDESRVAILPRELTEGFADEARNAPPPPTPILAEPYALRLVEPDADAEMIAEWIEHAASGRDVGVGLAGGALAANTCSAQLDGNYSRPFVGSLHGQPGGYVEVYRAAKDSVATRYQADANDIGVHAAIADLTLRHTRASARSAAAHRRQHLRARTAVVGESCSIPTIATPRRGGCVNRPAARSSASTT